ncbi:MAG: hypothetical protein QGD89_10805 [Actinomycetota bacterium]|nr:hypothetical protein [Actinomycetota bacterium]
MSTSDDYLNEMRLHQDTDRDIERLFDGTLDSASDLAPLTNLVASLRGEANTALDEEVVATFVQSASAALSRQRAAVGAAPRVARPRASSRGSLRRRVVTTAMAAAVFVGGMSGMAIAADDAKPGDALYSIDRAFEAVGIGDGKADERLAEVKALFDAGDVPRGLRHAANLVEVHRSDHPEASSALSDAADRMSSGGGSDQLVAVREMVAGLLTQLSARASDFDGPLVADLARGIGRSDDRPGSPPAGRPSSGPGSSDNRLADPPGRPDSTPGSRTLPDDKP